MRDDVLVVLQHVPRHYHWEVMKSSFQPSTHTHTHTNLLDILSSWLKKFRQLLVKYEDRKNIEIYLFIVVGIKYSMAAILPPYFYLQYETGPHTPLLLIERLGFYVLRDTKHVVSETFFLANLLVSTDMQI